MSSPEAVPVTSSKAKKIRGGHKAHLTMIFCQVEDCMKGFNINRLSELLAFRESLERKASIIAKLDEEVLEKTEEEEEIIVEIENCETIQLHARTRIIRDKFVPKEGC